ncbi:MAG TPA: pyridoxal 5'-phosphate synthase glutaminase subunit PdxT, partial [Candidatus Sulfotelmatobacter sp.]|nr:pyridoxal 5'-phosphate synthase glutaminase subunit PdxT [Candidatus Sulfotelmatobacter sp.]
MKIGILAIQGDFQAHAEMFHKLGVQTVEVRTVADLQGCDGLVLPGGESTTQLQFLQEEGLYDAIRQYSSKGGAIFGTCAGAILLATKVKNPAQESLKLLDMTVLRNGYGR